MTEFHGHHNTDAYNAAQEKLLAALARREYAYYELCQKYSGLFDAELLQTVLDDFVAKGWQSDARYAESYANSAVARGKGALLIRQALRQQQVSDNLINDALAAHDFDQVIAQVYAKKYSDPIISDPKERLKRQRFLVSRGFSFEQINQVLNHHD